MKRTLLFFVWCVCALIPMTDAQCTKSSRSCESINRIPCQLYSNVFQRTNGADGDCGSCRRGFAVLGIEAAGRVPGTLSCSLDTTLDDPRARPDISFSDSTGLKLGPTILFAFAGLILILLAQPIGACIGSVYYGLTSICVNRKGRVTSTRMDADRWAQRSGDIAGSTFYTVDDIPKNVPRLQRTKLTRGTGFARGNGWQKLPITHERRTNVAIRNRAPDTAAAADTDVDTDDPDERSSLLH